MNYKTHKERQAAFEKARSKSIVEVARELDMNLVKNGRTYTWDLHDSLVIDPNKNIFYWNSQQFGGGVVKLVQTIKECDYKTALSYLAQSDVKEFEAVTEKRKPFEYHLKEHRTIDLATKYLKEERGLSDETIAFFHEQCVLAEASYTTDYEHHKGEPVIVFKNIDNNQVIKGFSAQGVWRKQEYGKREHLKRSQGDGLTGMMVKIGQPPTLMTASKERPMTVIAFEAPIDLMSYYELFQHQLKDVILVAMNGLKTGVISKLVANEMNSDIKEELKVKALEMIDQRENLAERLKILLAVDNDEAGQSFKDSLEFQSIQVVAHLPKQIPGRTKTDWNDMLRHIKQPQTDKFKSRINVARQQDQNMAAVVTETHLQR